MVRVASSCAAWHKAADCGSAIQADDRSQHQNKDSGVAGYSHKHCQLLLAPVVRPVPACIAAHAESSNPPMLANGISSSWCCMYLLLHGQVRGALSGGTLQLPSNRHTRACLVCMPAVSMLAHHW